MAAAVEKTAALRQPIFIFFCVLIQLGRGKELPQKKIEKKFQKKKATGSVWAVCVCVLCVCVCVCVCVCI